MPRRLCARLLLLHLWAPLLVGSACLGLSALASAQSAASDGTATDAQRALGWPVPELEWVEAGLVASERQLPRDDLTILSPSAAALFRLNARSAFFVEVSGVLLLDTTPEGTSWVGSLANPLVGASYRARNTGTTLLDVGLGAIAPVAFLGRDALAGQRRAALAWAAGMRGLWNAWQWAPEQGGLFVQASYERYLFADWVLQVEAAVAATVSVGVATQDAGDVYGQLALGWEGRPLSDLRFGMRFHTVWVTRGGDGNQWAVTPHVAFRVRDNSWLMLSALVNLDEPLGYAGTGMDLWALALGIRVEP